MCVFWVRVISSLFLNGANPASEASLGRRREGLREPATPDAHMLAIAAARTRSGRGHETTSNNNNIVKLNDTTVELGILGVSARCQ